MRFVAFALAFIFITDNGADAIDENEQIGLCARRFSVARKYTIYELEGIWFPQYRTRNKSNFQYKCHILYETSGKDDGISTLDVHSYFMANDTVRKAPYSVSYRTDLDKGLLIETADVEGIGEIRIYNFVLKSTKQYRVRYVCTDYIYVAKVNFNNVYIETRSMKPELEVINEAVGVIRKSNLSHIILDKIDQKNCKRPTFYNGYE
ncbi:uncharacterized protein LOC106667884 [Cimex lectularius]|uniref:Salivary lipocalin n=1 Tax=Cimex lectularius TaxID=79782 RepID=A0A8I6RWT8_CIMLE|nr:uncharacterized protein LOC106667884 [Cimex lectularius]